MNEFIVRLIWIPISACFLVFTIRMFSGVFFLLFYSETSSNSWDITYFFQFLDIFVFTWIITHIVFEIIEFAKPHLSWKYWLKHLRYAPLAIFLFSNSIILVFEPILIQYSKYELRQYIFNASQTTVEPQIALYNDYRSFCGNGALAYRKGLYFETASSGLNNENPFIHSRSLLSIDEIDDSFFNGTDYRFEDALLSGCENKNHIVRETSESILKKRGRTCKTSNINKSN